MEQQTQNIELIKLQVENQLLKERIQELKRDHDALLFTQLTQAAKLGVQLANSTGAYTLGQACERLELSRPTLARYIKQGKIRKTADGRISQAEIDQFLNIK